MFENMPATGEIKAGVHIYPVRVFYEDTDAGGIVYYANYLRFAERARTEFIRLLGWSHSAMMAGDMRLAFAVKSCVIDYKLSALLDDILYIETQITEVKGASVVMVQTVKRGEEDLVSILVRLACVNLNDKKPARLPAEIKKLLTDCVESLENSIIN